MSVGSIAEMAQPLSDSLVSLGQINIPYISGAIKNYCWALNAGTFQLNFTGAFDLPYTIWASPDLTEWNQIGTASIMPYNRSFFQFNDTSATNSQTRFYQVRGAVIAAPRRNEKDNRAAEDQNY